MTNDHNGGDDNDDDGGHLSITFEVATRHRTASAWISRSRPRPSSRTRARISLQLDAILHKFSVFIVIAVLIVRLLAYSRCEPWPSSKSHSDSPRFIVDRSLHASRRQPTARQRGQRRCPQLTFTDVHHREHRRNLSDLGCCSRARCQTLRSPTSFAIVAMLRLACLLMAHLIYSPISADLACPTAAEPFAMKCLLTLFPSALYPLVRRE